MAKKISVIMGIYNCSSTLAQAIDSLLSQTYDNWQLIMCDDGSCDDTYAIASNYATKHPEKIILIKNKKNMGLNFTLNHCLKYADGEYIARMDGDDISLPQRFEKEIEFLENNPLYAIVSCPMIYFDKNGNFRTGVASGEPNINSIAKGTPFCHAPCMVRIEAYRTVNGYTVDDKCLRVEDWDLWVRMYEKGYRGYNLAEPLYKMRDDRNATARRKFKYRLNEARVTASAIIKLKLPKIYCIWILRPIIVGLLPNFIYIFLHKRKLLKR